jgi:dihydroorotate dehydrogenase electron transfer subunit
MALLSDRTRGQYVAAVVSNDILCREHYRLTLRIDGFPSSRPGQFVQISCRFEETGEVEHEFDWSPGERLMIEGDEFRGVDAFLRRPFSIAGRREVDGVSEIDIIGREVGPGTRFLSRLKPGQQITVLGPLGNTFALPEPGGTALLVGGGVGIPPMIYLAQSIAEAYARDPAQHRSAIAFCGALTRDLLALTVESDSSIREFNQFGARAVITTDDGTFGIKGLVTKPLEEHLDSTMSSDELSNAILYTCGPEPMMKAVQAIALKRGVRCQIAVERAMACGMGTCQSCCIRVKKDDPAKPPLEGKDWCYRLACTDGPVFDATKLLW